MTHPMDDAERLAAMARDLPAQADPHAELRALLAAADARPWTTDGSIYVFCPRGVVADIDAMLQRDFDQSQPVALRIRGVGRGAPQEGNLALVCAAVNALPGLLDDVARLTRERDEARQRAHEIAQKAQVATLRADLLEEHCAWLVTTIENVLSELEDEDEEETADVREHLATIKEVLPKEADRG